jgi:hypothetical protein
MGWESHSFIEIETLEDRRTLYGDIGFLAKSLVFGLSTGVE